MLAPEQSNFAEGVLQINGLGPFHRHEVLAIFEVIKAMVIFTIGSGLKKGNVPIVVPLLYTLRLFRFH